MSAQEFKPGDRVRTHNGVGTVRGPNAPATVEYDDGGWDSLSNPRIIASIVHLPEHAEPEDKDDLYVEPEPLKEGDWVLVWAKVEDEQYINTESNVLLSVVDADDAPGNVWARHDAIVRPSAGQVPPWVKPARCTSLKATGRTTLHRCEGEEGHGGDHVVGWVAWTDAEAYGRVEAS